MPDHSAADSLRIVLFDVGGVLVELQGVNVILEWLDHRMTAQQLWHHWLRSPAVRQFETGRIDQLQFATDVIREFSLPVTPARFLAAFAAWPTGLYPRTLEVLERIPRSYRRALLSNSNPLHWPQVIEGMGLGPAFDHHFVSHLTGRIKPDADAYEHVIEALGCEAGEFLFLDDNQINVDAARSVGMQAVRVRGMAEAEQALIAAGVIGSAATR